MDLSRIKHFIKQNSDKFIVVENGEPELVVMSFGEYERMAKYPVGMRPYTVPQRNAVPSADRDTPSIEEQEETEFEGPVIAENMKVRQTGGSPMRPMGSGPLVRLEDIRLEDLPL